MFYMSFLNFSEEVASDLTLGEKLNSILTTCVAGFALVFLVLGIIWFILAIFGKLFDKKSAETAEAEMTYADPAPAPTAPAPTPQTDDAAVVAAIVAAISAYSGKPAGGFRVVSFRKKH